MANVGYNMSNDDMDNDDSYGQEGVPSPQFSAPNSPEYFDSSQQYNEGTTQFMETSGTFMEKHSSKITTVFLVITIVSIILLAQSIISLQAYLVDSNIKENNKKTFIFIVTQTAIFSVLTMISLCYWGYRATQIENKTSLATVISIMGLLLLVNAIIAIQGFIGNNTLKDANTGSYIFIIVELCVSILMLLLSSGYLIYDINNKVLLCAVAFLVCVLILTNSIISLIAYIGNDSMKEKYRGTYIYVIISLVMSILTMIGTGVYCGYRIKKGTFSFSSQ